MFERSHPPSPVLPSRLELFKACLLVLRGPCRPHEHGVIYRPVLFRPWWVEAAMQRMPALLADQPRSLWLGRFLLEGADGEAGTKRSGLRRRAALATVFLVGFELAKRGAVELEQEASKPPSLRRLDRVGPKARNPRCIFDG